jgi:DNA-binding ferritin-like protein
MIKLLTLLDALSLAYHTAHHVSRGVTYFGDHEFDNAYSDVLGQFDILLERAYFLGLEPNQPEIVREAAKLVTIAQDAKPERLFAILLAMESGVCAQIERVETAGKCSRGTCKLLDDIADASEVRQGHIKRRLLAA